MPARVDHVTVTAADIERSVAFYDSLLAVLGWTRVVAFQDFEDEDEVGEEAVGYGADEAVELWVVAGRRPTSGAHVAVTVDSREAVDQAALRLGASARTRDHVRGGYYGVSGDDPDGNTLEVFTIV